MPIEDQLIKVRLEDIIPNRFQPRLNFDDKALNELADSIKQHGIIQPLVLRRIGDKFEIIAGERRYKASSMIGLKEIPAVIVDLDDTKSAEVAIAENIQRKDLNPIEEAKAYKKLLDMGQSNQEQLALRMGKAQPTIANKLRLLNLDEEVQEALMNNKISERHARSLLAVKETSEQKEILRRIIENRLTVRQTEDLIKTWTKEEKKNEIGGTSMNNELPVQKAIQGNNVDSVPISALDGNTALPSGQISPSNISEVTSIPTTNSDNQTIGSQLVYDSLNNDLEKTQVLDINEIKRAAEDINKPYEAPNIDLLLKTDTVAKEPIQHQKPKMSFSGRFFPSLEDEETDMNVGSDIVSGNGESNFPSFNNLIQTEEPKKEVAPLHVNQLLEKTQMTGLDATIDNSTPSLNQKEEAFDLSGLKMPDANISNSNVEETINLDNSFETVVSEPPADLPVNDNIPKPTYSLGDFNIQSNIDEQPSPEPITLDSPSIPQTNQNIAAPSVEELSYQNISAQKQVVEPITKEVEYSTSLVLEQQAESLPEQIINDDKPVEPINLQNIPIVDLEPISKTGQQDTSISNQTPPPPERPKTLPQEVLYPTLDRTPEQMESDKGRKDASNTCRYIINQTRGFVDRLEREGHQFDVDEYDLVNTYQITISIPK